jgi:hypothetical protein
MHYEIGMFITYFGFPKKKDIRLLTFLYFVLGTMAAKKFWPSLS